TAVISGFGVTAYQLECAHRLRRIDDELQKRSTLVTTGIRPSSRGDGGPPGEGGPPRPPPGEFERNDFDREPPPKPPEHDAASKPEFRLPRSVANLFEANETNGYYYVVWQNDGQMQARSANAPASLALPVRGQSDQWQWARTRDGMRESIRFTTLDRCVLIGRPIRADLAELHRLRWWLTLAGATVLALGLAG